MIKLFQNIFNIFKKNKNIKKINTNNNINEIKINENNFIDILSKFIKLYKKNCIRIKELKLDNNNSKELCRLKIYHLEQGKLFDAVLLIEREDIRRYAIETNIEDKYYGYEVFGSMDMLIYHVKIIIDQIIKSKRISNVGISK